MKKITKLFAYYRVSTTKQEDKATHETQRFSVNKWSEEKNFEIKEEFMDAISGKDSTRPNFNNLLNRIDEVDGIIVYESDRLVRDLETGMQMMFLLRNKNKKIWISRTREIKDFQLDTNQLIAMIGYWADERERKKIVDRLRTSIQRRIEEGKGWGPEKKEVNLKDYMILYNNKIIKGNKTKIAKILGISMSTLYRRLNEHKENLHDKEYLNEYQFNFLETHEEKMEEIKNGTK